MKKTLIALILLSTNFIFSQSVITGKVIDGEFNELLPFANVLLLTAEGENIDGTSTDFDGAFTFECFIYLDSLQNGSNGYQSIAGRWEGTGSHYCWLTDIEPNGKWTWYYSDTGGSSIYSIATPTGTISAQTWHHIACVKNGSSGRLLVDGSQAAYKSDFNKGNSDSTQDSVSYTHLTLPTILLV